MKFVNEPTPPTHHKMNNQIEEDLFQMDGVPVDLVTNEIHPPLYNIPFSQENELDNRMMEMCQGMDVYPPHMPFIQSEEAIIEVLPVIEPVMEPIVRSNNEMNQEMEILNPDKSFYKIVDDLTLAQFNGGQEDENIFEQPNYMDLDALQQAQQAQDMEFDMSEYQPVTKEGLVGLLQGQEYQMYRAETQYVPSNEYSNIGMHPEEIDYKRSPSASPPTNQLREFTIDDYYRDNNTNSFPSAVSTPRSRKYSTTSSCGGKMANGGKIIGKIALDKEKPYHTRKTKAQMNAMTEAEKIERKKEQNRNNAKNCVSRKNGNKKVLQERIPTLQKNLQILTDNNGYMEKEMINVYKKVILPTFRNNSPYGDAKQFEEEIDISKKTEAARYDNNGYLLIEAADEKFKKAKEEFHKVEAAKGDPTVPQNTHASRKSRAKTAMELAKLEFETLELNVEIQKAKKAGEVLEEFAQRINGLLRGINQKTLPEKIVYTGFVEFEPS